MDSDHSTPEEEQPPLPPFVTPPPEIDGEASPGAWLTRRLGAGLLLSALVHALALLVWLARPDSAESVPDPRTLRLTLQTHLATPAPVIEAELPVEPVIHPPAEPEPINTPPEPAHEPESAPSIDYRTLNISDYYTPPEDPLATSSSRVFDPRMRQQIAEAGRGRARLQAAGQSEPTPWGGSLGNSSTAFGKGRCVYHTDQGDYIGMVLSRTLCPDPISEGQEIMQNVQRSLDNP